MTRFLTLVVVAAPLVALASSGPPDGYDQIALGRDRAVAVAAAFVTKLDPAGRVLYTTYLDGGGLDGARGIAVAGERVYVAGFSESPDFPGFHGMLRGRADAYVAVLDGATGDVRSATFFG